MEAGRGKNTEKLEDGQKRPKKRKATEKNAWGKTEALRKQKHLAIVKGRRTAGTMRPENVPPKSVKIGYPARLPVRRKDGESVSTANEEGTEKVPESRGGKDPEAETGAPQEEELIFITGDYSSVWNKNHARLQFQYDSKLQGKPLKDVTPILNSQAEEWATAILETEDDTANIESYQSRFKTPWRTLWLHSMQWILHNSVEDAPKFLKITHTQPYPPSSWVADTLQYLAARLGHGSLESDGYSFDTLIDLFCVLSKRPNSPSLVSPGSFLSLLLPRCSAEQVQRLLTTIREQRVEVHWRTLLQFSGRLARLGHFEEALGVLLDAASAGADIDSQQFKSNCAIILRKSIEQHDGLRVSLRIVSNLVSLGVKLNIQLCNILVLNAVEAGDLKTAFSVYNSLVEHGIQADKYTHAILLKGCKSAIEDSQTLNETIRRAIEGIDILKAPIVATEILHALYLHHFHHYPDRAFSMLAEAYSQLFHTGALRSIGILSPQLNLSTANLQEPTLAAIGIMFNAYLRQYQDSSYQQGDRSAYALYLRFRDRVNEGKSPFTRLCETDHVANAFIMAFTQSQFTLQHALEVIQDIQRPITASSPKPDDQAPMQDLTITPSPPTVQTWSILLNGFTKHGKMNAAEQVLDFMRHKGIEPNQVSWNTLINGYAGVQDADGAIGAVRRMQDQGWRVNEITRRAMGRLRSRADGGLGMRGRRAEEVERSRRGRERGWEHEDEEWDEQPASSNGSAVVEGEKEAWSPLAAAPAA